MRAHRPLLLHLVTLAVVVSATVALALALPSAGRSNTAEEAKAAITTAEVNAAQQAWCDGLVKIGKAYSDGGDYKAVAAKVIDDLYDYEEGKVFFKPTL